MQFSLLGIPIFVQLNFWFTAVFLGMGFMSQPALLALWVLCVFLSVIVHELGHATVMMRYGLRPEIALHGMGGHAAAHGLNRLSRGRKIFVSFAGPMAGFVFGLLWIVLAFVVDPAVMFRMVPFEWLARIILDVGGSRVLAEPRNLYLAFFFAQMAYINIAWGFLNLAPVLPLDGGHILEDALGPRRYRITCYVSLAFCGLAIAYNLWAMSQGDRLGGLWMLFIFGLCGYQTYMRLKNYDASTGRVRRKVPPPEPPLPQEVVAKLKQAELALSDERYEAAATQAELVLGENPPKTAQQQALQVMTWSRHLMGDDAGAKRTMSALRKLGKVDPGLEGTLLLAEGNEQNARELFEKARADGDDRKEVVGPLIQILLGNGEVPRAAAIALDIVDSLSDEDVEQMASIADDHGAHSWAARLYEALFERSKNANHAYEAARQRGLDGDLAAALVLLERAISAGFADAAKARTDEAFAAIRGGAEADAFETLLEGAS